MAKFDIHPQEILWGDNLEKEGGASAFMMGEEQEETEETLLADNADVEEE